MKNRELKNLLNRAAAALETPADLTPADIAALIEDLLVAAPLRSSVDCIACPLVRRRRRRPSWT